jgi:hypothetical protein
MASRNILNIDSGLRQINPRSGSSVFVDISSNQIIGGIKRFLNNLITNSDVNFNTTANVGRIIFNPNEPAGTGSQIVAIYTEDENNGQGWFFDSIGNLYYLGGGLSPVKIMLGGATGDLTILSNFNGFGDVICHNILTSNIISSNSGGDITFNNGIALGSNTINSGDITSNGNISGVSITGTTSLITNLINASTGTIKNLIQMDNRFIDTATGSVDIKSTYVGFPNLSQTLTTASNYMYIKPLTTGDFEMRILNKTKFILKTDIALNAIASQIAWAWMDESNIIHASINPNTTAGTTNNAVCKFYARVVDKSLYYTRNGTLGSQNETSLIVIWRIDENGNIFTSGTVNANTINPNSGTTISSTSIWNFKDATNTTNITLNPTAVSGDRLQIAGVSAGTTFLYYNTSNVLGVFNSITGANVWSINGTTGNINTIGTISYSTLTTNLISASTGTNKIQMDNRFFNPSVGSIDLKATYIGFPQLSQTLSTASKYMAIIPQSDGNFHMSINNIGSRVLVSDWANLILFSEFNQRFMKSAGNSRILMFNTSTSGDIFQICRTGANAYTDGYWYHNNTGNFGYNTGGVSVWELLNTGVITTNGGFISNGTQNNFNSSGLRAIYVPNGAIETYRLFVNESSNSAISVPNGGVTAYRMIANNYIQCLGQYIYCQHNLINDIAGLWSNRTGSSGSGLDGNANNWVSMGGMENNNGMAIGYPAYNYYGTNRVFMWMIENTVSSGKALGLAINKVNAPNSYINATNQSTGFALLGFFGASYRGAAAYSFTGEHSSMVCDEEYNDLMNYNTDDFIGMVVCSSGKIYNLPYTPDGDTYSKQVDNIKSIDAQPMTRLSKKYKDKSVLGVISHIEKVGKNRNDINATSWTGCMALDKDERRRIRIASIGEGAIWITNEYGNIENGDYITTSNIAGYSTKQDDDLLHNYTIAKATMDCSFDIEKPDDYKTKYLGDGVYASYIACTYHSG